MSTLKTPAATVDAAYALEKGASLDGTQMLTGVITKVDTAYNAQYGNVTVTIQVGDKADKLIQCYRMKGTGADVIKEGDTITVSGTIKNYNGTIEFDTGCILESYKAAPAAGTTVETFAIAASAGTLSGKTITWTSEHFNYLGEQGGSSTAIRTSDTNHYRVYQDSNFKISSKNSEGIKSVVITVTEAKYAAVAVASLTTAGATATADGTTVTITVTEGTVTEIAFTATAQFRVSTIEVAYV